MTKLIIIGNKSSKKKCNEKALFTMSVIFL